MGETVVNDAQERILKAAWLKVAIVNAAQLLTLTGGPTGGTFKLAWEGSGDSGTIAYNASAATVQSALEALSTIGSGNVSVSGSNGGPWTVTFIGALAGTPIPLLTKNVAGLTGGSIPSLTIAETVTGTGTIPQYFYVGLSHSTRETLGDAAAMSAIDEVTGTGYSRVRIKPDGSDIVVSLVSGFWRMKTKTVTFSATASDWNAANAIFITDKPDNTGKVCGLKTVTAFTLTNGQSQDLDYTGTFADAA